MLGKKFACALICLVALGACSGTEVEDFDLSKLFYDWTDSYLAIQNNTGVDIVVFRNSLESGNLLGGVEKGKEMRVKQLDGLQVLLAINAQDYLAGQLSNAKVLDSMVAYITTSYVTNVFVDKTQNGDGVLRFVNNTDKYLEVYSGYWGKTLVATVSPGMTQSQYLPRDIEMVLYPTLVSSITKSGSLIGLRREQITNIYLATPQPTVSTYTFSAPVVKNSFMYVYIKNNSSNGIWVMQGTAQLKNTLGRYAINLGGNVGVYEFAPNSTLDYVDLTTLKIANPTMAPVSIPSIRLTNGESHYVIVNSDNTVSINQAPF